MASDFEVRVTATVRRGPGVLSIRTAPPPAPYAAGQYFKVMIPETGLFRCLSASCAPARPHLELTKRLTDSPFSKAFASMEPGRSLRLSGPFGGFTGPRDAEPALLVAGGIGITPVMSVLDDRMLAGKPLDAVLLFGNQRRTEIPFRDELEEIRRATGTPVYYFVDTVEEGYCCGHITADWVRKLAPDFAHRRCWVSGPPAMVSFVRRELESIVESGRIVTENLSGYREEYP